MILFWLVILPLIAGVAAWIAARWSDAAPRWIALLTMIADFGIALAVWLRPHPSPWFAELDWDWIPAFGMHFHLAMDGLSLLMALLTCFLGVIAVLMSWREIEHAVGFFHLNLLWILGGILAVFVAVDLFLFYFAWELMLVPMYFLIAIWGHENRNYAAIKFFIYTQLSGLLMLAAILALYWLHFESTHVATFDYERLLDTALSPAAERWIMLGFLAAFLVKLPAFPLHTWLPDAHSEAPTAGSIILAGLMLKTGAYGLIRFAVPLFPHAAREFKPAAMILAVIGILYGAILAFGQTDLKRLIAYTSVSHLGFVLLGIYAGTVLALQGAVVTMICHGLSTGALFAFAGALQDRMHTRDLRQMGGLWSSAPRMGGAMLFFALASLGLPGLGDFIGEFLVLDGTFPVNVVITVIAATGMLAAMLYALYMMQRVFYGPNPYRWHISDLTPREGLAAGLMMAGLLWIGLYPQFVLNIFGTAFK